MKKKMKIIDWFKKIFDPEKEITGRVVNKEYAIYQFCSKPNLIYTFMQKDGKICRGEKFSKPTLEELMLGDKVKVRLGVGFPAMAIKDYEILEKNDRNYND